MKKIYLLPLLSLACILPTPALAVTKNVTINFTLNNLTLAEVDQFNTYISYNETMTPQTLLSGCTAPPADSPSPYAITCANVNIEQFPVYFKVAPVASGVEITSDQHLVPVPISVIQGFKLGSPTSPTPDGTVFLWSMETLPATTTTSDIGNVTITKQLNDAASITGVSGNGLEQTDVWQTYKFPMSIVPTTKGTISFYLKHKYSSADNSTSRYFFTSENREAANTLYAWVSRDDIWFYLFDSSGTMHRVYKQADSWAANTWYQYEFSWDEATGYMGIKRDNTVVVETSGSPWDSATPNWGSQDFYIGHAYEIGSFDEFSISQ